MYYVTYFALFILQGWGYNILTNQISEFYSTIVQNVLLHLSKVWSYISLPKTALSVSVSTHSSTSGLSGMATSYFAPVRALVTPVPKMLKSLLPKREEKKDMTIPPPSQPQVWKLHLALRYV